MTEGTADGTQKPLTLCSSVRLQERSGGRRKSSGFKPVSKWLVPFADFLGSHNHQQLYQEPQASCWKSKNHPSTLSTNPPETAVSCTVARLRPIAIFSLW